MQDASAGSIETGERKIHNNIFARCDKGGIVLLHEDNQADGNVYAALPERFAGLAQNDATRWLDLQAWRAHGWHPQGSVVQLELSFDSERLELTMDGLSAAPKVRRMPAQPFPSFVLQNSQNTNEPR